MNHIRYVEYSASHTQEFLFDQPKGHDCWLLLLTRTPALFWVDGGLNEYPAHCAVLFPPGSKIYYRACRDRYENDWLRFDSDEVFVSSLPLRGVPFPVTDPQYCHSLFQLLTWEHSFPGPDADRNIDRLLHILFSKLREAAVQALMQGLPGEEGISARTPDEPADRESAGRTPGGPADGESSRQTPDGPADGESAGRMPGGPVDEESYRRTPDGSADGESAGRTPGMTASAKSCVRMTGWPAEGSSRSHDLFSLRKEIYNSPQLPWSISSMAGRLHLSEGYLQSIYKQAFGISCMDDVIAGRIRLACDQLLYTDRSVAQVAEACGYNHVEHFCRQFKKLTGKTPGAYRAEQSDA